MKYDIGLITKFVIEYDVGVQKSVIFSVSLVLCISVFFLYIKKSIKPTVVRNLSLLLLAGYFLLVFFITILFRDSKGIAQYSLKLLWDYDALNYKLIAESILNVFLFIPIGFIAGAALDKSSIWKALGIGFVLSFSIEMMQYNFCCGVSNINDIIHNELGCCIGFGLFAICSLVFERKGI